MYKNKKAQAAMEFLMTYGWAILVVLIAIGALAYFGVLNPDRLLPEKCVIATGSGLFCVQHTAAVGSITIRVQNILNEDVIISAIDATVDQNACTTTSPNIAVRCSVTGGSGIIGSDETCDYTIACPLILAGDKIKGDLTISYTIGVGGLPKTTTGTIVTTAP